MLPRRRMNISQLARKFPKTQIFKSILEDEKLMQRCIKSKRPDRIIKRELDRRFDRLNKAFFDFLTVVGPDESSEIQL